MKSHARKITGFKDNDEKVSVASWLGLSSITYSFNAVSADDDDIDVFSMTEDQVAGLKKAYPSIKVERQFNIQLKILF